MAGKAKLSKHLLQMKFMQRSVVRAEEELNEEERQRQIDDEHWFLDIPELSQKESKYQLEPSYGPCENLLFGRMSFKGFNPDIEKLMRSVNTERELAEAEEREKEIAVDEEEMTERFENLVGTLAKKFSKKRSRTPAQEEVPSGPAVKQKRKGKEFLKPADD